MLFRYDRFGDLDRLTEQLLGGPSRAPWMPLDAVRSGDQVTLRFDVPGVQPDDIDVHVERNVVTVKARRGWSPAEGEEVLARERPQGEYSRQVMLGETLDAERLVARYENGVLSLTVPVAEQAKPRRVQIEVEPPAVDVASS